MANELDENRIVRFQGNTYPLIVTLTETINKVKVPIDLTGQTVTMKIGKETTVSIVGTIIDEADGKVQFEFADADVADAGEFSYTITTDLSGTNITTYVRNVFELTKVIS